MPDMMQDIEEFHKKFELVYEGAPRFLPDDLAKFRLMFMSEELDEYFDASGVGNEPNLEKQLDALVDLVYVALGTAYLHGFGNGKFNEAWRRVHAANMTKVRALRAEDSTRGSTYDVVKPAGWQAPDHSDLVV